MKFSAVNLLFLPVVLGAGAAYDEVLARYKLWPMASAAFSSHPEKCIADNFKKAELKGQYTVACDMFKNDTCSGFSAISHSDKAIILSFRGSEGDLQIADEIFEGSETVPFVGGGDVNEYFIDGFNLLWYAGMKNDFISLKNKNPGYQVWVTGHSLGAALGSIAAATISKLGYVAPDKIKFVSYGQPRIGNAGYAAAVDSLLPFSFRIVHQDDLVPHLPLKGFLGYVHHKAEVWYNNNMTVDADYVVCDADEGANCSDSIIQLNPADHDFYFHYSYRFAVDGCAGYNPYH